MKKKELINRCDENPVFWRTESGKALGFQSSFPEPHTMIISDGKGKFYTARHDVEPEGKSGNNGAAQYYVELEE